MARLEALLLCDYVVTGPDGKIQLQGIFDRIFVGSLPASHPMAFLYFRFFLDKVKAPYTVVTFSISRPDGMTEKMAEFKVPVNDAGKAEGNVALKNFPLYVPGAHSIEVHTGGEKVGSYRFLVEFVKTASGGSKKNESLN